MKSILFVITFYVIIMGDTYSQELKDPTVTEIWEPVVRKIDPGKQYGDVPSDALVLFNGKNLDVWESVKGGKALWDISQGAMLVKPGTGDIRTKQSFGSAQLHIEWKSPSEIKGEGQGRGNSGIFLQERYEVQVLDSYESKTYSNGQAGSIYKQYPPLVNATKSPGEWQTYDIIFKAPVFNERGEVTHPATVTVLHNGVLIQNNVTLWGGTEYRGLPTYRAHGKAPIILQDHGDLVEYKNIWIREL